ncbi:hypothetical protein PR048_016016 [Dryococelus australis]|uniref:Uncharacterized protein n=1 Tax=Dryococelus australis TaxID=614101 RepID=A0ABQ9HIJ7_9NEOP|nr:hypothetical protein PR048_016016 [Dryococelus australis]
MKINTSSEDCTLQIDFAENFSIIQRNEIQSAHWSHQQVTIFTGCVWVAELSIQVLTKLQFSVMGLQHNLKISRYTLSNLFFVKEDLFMDCEWNFLATSHGKGAVDGVGGCI